jgi:hypothetical protein
VMQCGVLIMTYVYAYGPCSIQNSLITGARCWEPAAPVRTECQASKHAKTGQEDASIDMVTVFRGATSFRLPQG